MHPDGKVTHLGAVINTTPLFFVQLSALPYGLPLGTLKIAIRDAPTFIERNRVPVKLRCLPFFEVMR